MEQYVCQRCSEVTFFKLIPVPDSVPDECIYCGESRPATPAADDPPSD